MTTLEPPPFPELDQVLRPQSFQDWHPPLAAAEPNDILCGAITMDDLNALLGRLPARSTPGPSQVTYGFLKHAPSTAKLILLEGLSALLEPEGHRSSEHIDVATFS